MSVIDSNYLLPDIESHFKVYAGPGAGKTRFLVNHIKNILNNSSRLKIQRKVACITYTNVATETILARVGDHAGRLEISTIHSFLYKYLIKPYVHLISSHYGLDASSIDGHDDVVFSGYQFIRDWKQKTTQTYLDDKDVVLAWSKLRWKFDGTNALVVSPPYPMKSGTYNLKKESYMAYKKMTWERGFLHHDDVLFFSYELITRLPFVLEVLRAQFPYFLIDEFQDTNPIQIKIVELIAQRETVVGVVGDEGQSIYGFLGAVSGQLRNFVLSGMVEYQINDNWRSSDQIVALLNKVRPKLLQNPLRRKSSTDVVVIVGDKLAALQHMEATYPEVALVTLSRDNLIANSLNKKVGIGIHKDLLVELKNQDKDSTRRRTISNATKAIEYVKMGYFKDAIKAIGKLYNNNRTNTDKKKSLRNLKILLEKEDEYLGQKLITLYNLIQREGIADLTKLKAGAAKTFYDSTIYDHLALSVKNLYEAGAHRTIHKSKGEEFPAVMVVLDKDEKGKFNQDENLSFLLKPDLSDEENRIMYVAISRAQDHLAISVPALSEENKARLKAMSIKVHELP